MDAGGLCVDDLGRLELAAAADAPGRVAATPVPPAVGIVAEAFGREGAVPVVAAVVAVSAVAELPAVPAKVAVPVVLVARQGLEPWESFGTLTRAGISSTGPGTD